MNEDIYIDEDSFKENVWPNVYDILMQELDHNFGEKIIHHNIHFDSERVKELMKLLYWDK